MSTPKSSQPITFYDIGSGPSSFPFAPNPWKTRLALSFSSAPHTTTFIPLPSIPSTRAALHLPPNRKHPDGSAFPTLPIIHDHTTNTLLGDSFDIALHLHTHYPSTPPLFPPHTVALHRAFNAQVDAVFAAHGAPLVGYYMPFDPATAEQSKREMLARLLLPEGEWEVVRGWNGGVWGRLADALEKWTSVS
ncbi:hypothetical protein F5144DRAFT_611756 [Chaetomium tenue]|uniref:Uncharacterized protein n=1 Tax=Chaetomium tenue TaxID=1854479 RepID=A0ACB7PD74_9PEZI|nr:hypothetical protein F5144DRAFT_611756 [Chaetomium globosum]